MTAKEYLGQIHKYKRAAESLAMKAEQLRAEVAGLKAITYDGVKVQTSPTDKMSELVPKLIEIEERYGEALYQYHKAILIRSEQIENIGRSDYSEILRLRYVDFNERGFRHTLEEIAVKTHRSFDWVRHMHGNALKAFERKYL